MYMILGILFATTGTWITNIVTLENFTKIVRDLKLATLYLFIFFLNFLSLYDENLSATTQSVLQNLRKLDLKVPRRRRNGEPD